MSRRVGPAQQTDRSSPEVVLQRKYGMRVAHNQHTGRKLSLRYTSYTVLFFLLVMTGATLLFASHTARADQQTMQGSIDLNGQVSGPPPGTAAVITSPLDGQHFSTNIIDVKGTCSPGLIIEIYRYNIFAGSVFCSNQGTFSLTITLIPGQNDLKARSRNGGGQYGPDSAIVTVFYDVPKAGTPGAPLPTALPFLIYTQPVQRGVSNQQSLTIKYEINGGKAPYAIAIDWGDGSKVDAYSQTAEGDFTASHTFSAAGQYTISISGSDAARNRAFIQSIGVMQGPTQAVGVTQSTCADPATASGNYCAISNKLQQLVDAVWPAFIMACLMTLSFWLGERVIYQRLKNRPTPTQA